MKSILLRTVLLFSTVITITVATSPIHAGASRNDDEVAIRENVKKLEAGWNKKSGKLFASAFAEDADYVVINGRYIKGRPLIESMHQQIFDTIFKETTIILAVAQIRFLKPDVAVVHVKGHRESTRSDMVQNGMLTMVMTRDRKVWKIVAFQNTQVTSP